MEKKTNNWMSAGWRASGRYLYELCRAGLNNEEAPMIPDEASWEQVFQLAGHNSIQSIAYYVLLHSPKLPEDFLMERWKKDLFFTVSRQTQMDLVREQLALRMDEENVDYLFLKGIVLQDYYPREGMRQMSDNDILYRYQNEDERGMGSQSQKKMKEIMESLNACSISDDGVVDVFLVEPLSLFEMHREFLGPDHPLYDYYHHLLDLASPEDPSRPHRLSLSLEEHYILMLVHSYKHYSSGGCGPREILDCRQYVSVQGKKMDWDLTKKKLQEFGLLEYEEMLRHLSDVIFGLCEGSEEDWEKLDWFMGCGTYGSRQNAIRNTLAEMESEGVSPIQAKARYIWKRLFPEPAYLQTHFPFFYRHRSMIIFLLVYRTARGLAKSRSRLFKEWKDIQKV